MNEWIKWDSGDCPVKEGTLVDVQHRDGNKYTGCNPYGTLSLAYDWVHSGSSGDIVAYRLHEPQNSAEQHAESTESLLKSLAEVREEIKPLLEREIDLVRQLKVIRRTITDAISGAGSDSDDDYIEGFERIDPSKAFAGDYVIWDEFDSRDNYEVDQVSVGKIYEIKRIDQFDSDIRFRVNGVYTPYTTSKSKFRTYRKVK